MQSFQSAIKFSAKKLLLGSLTALLLGNSSLFAEESSDPIKLNFGVYSSNKPTAMVRKFKPTLKALENSMSKILGQAVNIRMQVANSYDQGVADLIKGKVDFSRFGPASYIEAKRENNDLQLLAMESKKNAKVFYGVIAVHNDSDIETPEQLRNRTFAFGAESSTIGRYLSQHFLVSHNIFADDLSKYKYLGRHDKVGTAVGAKDFDAGALNESTFKKLVAAGEPIRELARFPNVTKPWIARSGLEPKVFMALQESLYTLKDARTLKSLKADGFLPGTDSDYETIRLSMEQNNSFFKKRLTTAGKTLAKQAAASAMASDHSIHSTADIQINIQFEESVVTSGEMQNNNQPLVVNVTIPRNMSSQAVVVTTSRDANL